MPKILVIGDLMIDHYVWGSCERISPEAPVQVVLKQNENKRLGGCGNVVSNLISLGAEVGVISVVGDDNLGNEILDLISKRGAKTELIIKEKNRKSSQKSRIMVAHQQVLRVDTESICDIDCEDEIINKFDEILTRYDLVLLSDYGKGVLTKKLCKSIIDKTTSVNKFILADPKGKNYSKYSGATLLTPNKKEAATALDMDLNSTENINLAALKLKENFNLEYGLITLSEEGIVLCDKNSQIKYFPALAKEVFDVTGAGDSVLATLGYCLALDRNLDQAIETANLAAAVVVGKVGSADPSWNEIEALKSTKIGLERKIVDLNTLLGLYLKDKKVVFTNGCFDILHVGHISYLQKAKELGDILIVGLNSDRSVRALKGEPRPVNKEEDRAKMLAALECVDFVVIFDDDTPHELIKALKPDILVKGADYMGKKVVGSEFAKITKLIDFVEGKSTTNLINKIKG